VNVLWGQMYTCSGGRCLANVREGALSGRHLRNQIPASDLLVLIL